MEPDKKKCPYCGKEIMVSAKKCRYCGEWLNDENPVLSENKKIFSVSSTTESKKANAHTNFVRNIIIALIGVAIIAASIYFINSSRHGNTEDDTAIEEIIIEPDEDDYFLE